MPKPKGTPGGNKNPVKTKEFLACIKPPAPDVPEGVELAAKPLSIKVPVDIDMAIRALPNRSEWLRRVICEAAQKELL